MELSQAIAERRSIRKYKSTPVEPEKIAAIIESARLCQSGTNTQPWRFMILTGCQKEFVPYLMEDHYNSLDEEHRAASRSSLITAQAMHQAPVLILVFRVPAAEGKYVSDVVSIGAAIEHMCLTATDLGLGSLWIRQTRFIEDQLSALLGYPDYQMISAVAIGYADEAPAPRPRKSTEEIVIKPR